jgi:hypothetical protein
MPLEKLWSLGTYEQINGGMHRRAAPIVGTPAMVRRIGLWNTGCASASPQGKEIKTKLDQDERLRRYKKYLKDLKSILVRENKKTTHFDPEKLLLITDSKVTIGTLAIFRFYWRGMYMMVRVESHLEYITITSILDLSVERWDGYIPTGPSDIQTELKLLAHLFKNNDKTDRDIYHSIASVQDRMWKEFQLDIIDGELNGQHILGTRLGEVFADFHGMISGSTITSAPGKPLRQEMRPAFENPLVRGREKKMNYAVPPETWFYDTLERLWPLLHSDKALRDYEFTAGAFLNRRALYVSALGPQPLRQIKKTGMSRQVWPWKPVYYYIQAHTDDEWQIGRLIDRINMLGTLRLAATMEVASLMKAGPKVNDLIKEINRVFKLIQAEITKMKFGVDAEAQEARNAGIKRIDEKVNNIQKELWKINAMVSSDISYRLERSSFYRQQFEREALGLRERRIEGYQKYQEFVSRRLRMVFGYFDLLRQRMDEVSTALAALGRQYSSLKATLVTREIDELVTTMRNEGQEVSKIQEFGEVALIGILLPYYVGMIAFHVFDMEHHSGRLYWLLVIMTLFIFILVGTRREKDWGTKSGKQIAGMLARRLLFRPDAAGKPAGKPWMKNVSLLFITYALIMWLVFGTVLAVGSDKAALETKEAAPTGAVSGGPGAEPHGPAAPQRPGPRRPAARVPDAGAAAPAGAPAGGNAAASRLPAVENSGAATGR